MNGSIAPLVLVFVFRCICVLASRSVRFTPRLGSHSTHWMKSLGSHREDLEAVSKRTTSYPRREPNPDFLACSLISVLSGLSWLHVTICGGTEIFHVEICTKLKNTAVSMEQISLSCFIPLHSRSSLISTESYADVALSLCKCCVSSFRFILMLLHTFDASDRSYLVAINIRVSLLRLNYVCCLSLSLNARIKFAC